MVMSRGQIYSMILVPPPEESFNRELELSLGDCLYEIFQASPESDDGAWFERLNDPEFWVGKTRKEVAQEVPINLPNTAEAWREFLVTCHCPPGDEAAESNCGIHILLRLCDRGAELAEQILMGQLTES
jgi:hypothetical protein